MEEASRQDYFVTPEQLSIGLFVFIDLPWFSHPFSFNSFKIRSPDQIETLRGLGVKRFRYDPDRSDAPQFPASTASAQTGSNADSANRGIAAGANTATPEAAPDAEAEADPTLAAKRERIARLQQRREQINNVERAFVKAASIVRGINRSLLSRPRECMEEVGALIDQMAQVFLEAPDLTLHVMGEKAGGEEVYFHGLNTSILCLMLARDLGVAGEDARLLGLGALLHDIGLMEIPDRVLKKTEELTRAETELRKLHCEYGLRLAQKVGLPDVVQKIIHQHHEMMDGSGYPQALRGEAIHPAARIVALVNHYDNLCNPVDLARAMTPHEALSLMYAQRRNKFEARALQLMIKSLGVYPPGTVVKLSNDALALVQSVNPQKPLRPWVLIYDPGVPKEEAIMLDLELEPEINISKAIRPIQLPAAVYDYLSPRKRVTYFFDADSKPGGNAK